MEKKEVHDNREKCKEQAYTMVAILGMEGKKKTILRIEGKQIFYNFDHNSESEYRGQV